MREITLHTADAAESREEPLCPVVRGGNVRDEGVGNVAGPSLGAVPVVRVAVQRQAADMTGEGVSRRTEITGNGASADNIVVAGDLIGVQQVREPMSQPLHRREGRMTGDGLSLGVHADPVDGDGEPPGSTGRPVQGVIAHTVMMTQAPPRRTTWKPRISARPKYQIYPARNARGAGMRGTGSVLRW